MPEATSPAAARMTLGTESIRPARAAGPGLRGLDGGAQHWTSPFAGKRIHLIGIGGSGMRGLAGVLLRCGARVSGSDRIDADALHDLAALGATIHIGQSPKHLPADADLVVYSAAIADDNPELRAARAGNLPLRKYAQMLGEVMRLRTGIAIAGTHGKSTTTAMVSYILRQSDFDPTFVIGAAVDQLGGSCGVGDGPHFVVEACEYDASFLNLSPHLAAILNIEEDHLDYYKNLQSIIEAFKAFASLLPADGVLIANRADRAVAFAIEGIGARVETFGVDADAHWCATDLCAVNGHYRFRVRAGGRPFLDVRLDRIAGRHQVSNALVATAIAHHCGVAAPQIAGALATFEGADRRLTHRATVRGIDVFDDYGHHPTEIQVTLRALRESHPGRRLWVIFQPHQHSRTRFLLADFARSFGQADHVLVPDIYFVRDSEAERDAVRSTDLVERIHANGGDALYLPDFDAIVEHLAQHAQAGDLVLTMGAGDVWKVADDLVRRLA
ncbi:MAG: UDP-N-acetylmuramate--L-alanine ligase [Phycisphaerae bacterium]|nr:UDP-N-acetylmuramate--L-alanine ligase [Phycisphaerae bacterium]